MEWPKLAIELFNFSIYTLRLQFTRVTQTSLDWFPKAILSGIRSTLAKQQITVLVYERNTKFKNLGYVRITSIRLKSAKLKKKTYYHAFLRNILAFNLNNIISEHICNLFKPAPLIRTQTGVILIQTNIRSSIVSSGLNLSHTCLCTVCGF